jgi:hypothetical protein
VEGVFEADVLLNDGGAVNNQSGGTISGGYAGVSIQGATGTVTNAGAINSGTGFPSNFGVGGVSLGSGGTVDNLSGGTINGQTIGVSISSETGSVTNAGGIYGGTALNSVGVMFLTVPDGSVDNLSGGTIDGAEIGVLIANGDAATVTNAGTIGGASNCGVELQSGGTVVNTGSIVGLSNGVSDGVFADGPTATVTNAGTISGANASVVFGGIGAFTLTLETGSTLIGDAYGSTASGATNALVLEGLGSASIDFIDFNTLAVDAGANWTLSGYSTIGTSTIDGELTITDGVLDTDFTIASGGTLEILGGGQDTAPSAHVTNDGTLDIGNGAATPPDIVSVASLANSGTINLDGNGSPGAEIFLAGTLDNTGSIVVVNEGDIDGAVSGAGSFTLDATSTLEFGSSVAAKQTITLDGKDQIALQEAQEFHALIASFGKGDSIDAMNFARGSTTFRFSENSADTLATLTLKDGADVAHFRLSGDYVKSDFKVVADAAGTGTLIKFV